jgi:site-specific recombinase XerD
MQIPERVHRIVKAAAERAGLSGESRARFAPWLRHTHASHSLTGVCPSNLVQQTLGHASVGTTGRYLHAPH